MNQNPFNQETKQARLFAILSDLDWHCGKHELPGTQPAKAIQILRQKGYLIENRTQMCAVCGEKTVHRRMLSTEPSSESSIRLALPQKLRRRILAFYKNTEAISLREMQPEQLEIDHRFPQVRWSQDESFDADMTDAEIQQRFQLLTRANNLWKSRYCERCKATRERGTYIGIHYFYAGETLWDSAIPDDDENGCVGCFWYDPQQWRASLNELIRRTKDS